jgi:hypothetical protein
VLIQARRAVAPAKAQASSGLLLVNATMRDFVNGQALQRQARWPDLSTAQLNATICWPQWKAMGAHPCAGCGTKMTWPYKVVVRPDPGYVVHGICIACSAGSDTEVLGRVQRRLGQQQTKAVTVPAASLAKAAPSKSVLDAEDRWRRLRHEQRKQEQARLKLQELREENEGRRARLARWEAEE